MRWPRRRGLQGPDIEGPAPELESTCRVCGLDEGDERWTGPDGAQYVICSCCGAESGVHDLLLSWVRQHRTRWAEAGYQWFDAGERPEGWDVERQLSHVPSGWR